MNRTLLAIALVTLVAAISTAQATPPNPKVNVAQSLVDIAKNPDPEARLKAYDALAKVVSPERVAPNPWKVSVKSDEANATTTFVISNKKIFDSTVGEDAFLSFAYVRRLDASDNTLQVFFHGANVDVGQNLSFQKNLDSIKYRFENGDTSEDKWQNWFINVRAMRDYYAKSPFPGKILHEISGHDYIFVTWDGQNYKFDIRGLAVALAKYSLSLDELIKVAEAGQGF